MISGRDNSFQVRDHVVVVPIAAVLDRPEVCADLPGGVGPVATHRSIRRTGEKRALDGAAASAALDGNAESCRRRRGCNWFGDITLTLMRAKVPSAFRTRRAIERYFSGDTIECLICGRHFKRLQTHLAAKHGMAADDYKRRFGLPWTRGLTSAASLANSGWTDERKAKARKLARRSRFFKLAHLTPRRELAPFLKAEAVEHTRFPRSVRIATLLGPAS
jgi:ROS/MUCR transcriptional regulator protein